MLWNWPSEQTLVYVLDLDGTLMPSAVIDNECFWQAVFACFGERDSLPDIHQFKDVTDSGILAEWCQLELGRPASIQETEQIKQHFSKLLEAVADLQPKHFKPIAGVVEWLSAIAEHSNLHAGIATGGWAHSARLKMKISGLDRFELPIASSDDAVARADIMQIALGRILKDQADTGANISYVGDGLWDFEASRKLGWNFIGIAAGARATQLKQAGAKHLQDNFQKSPA
jgi:phosphoglycolate phosphatase-like HAD superfamily hydrolase